MKKNIGISYKAFAGILAAVLVLGGTIGGTMAWLIDGTDAVANTFTYGDINIGLEEKTGNDYKIVPGVNITKDPTVTVKANSEDCWLFVKVAEENWPNEILEEDGTTKKVAYSIADGWTAHEGASGVYYRQVTDIDNDVSLEVLKDNQITVSDTLKKSEVNDVKAKTPKLTFTAYAVQMDSSDTAAKAWEKACNSDLY